MKSTNKKSKIELLSPAGDFECLQAAIQAGADAVYFGLQNFNMRARAKNFRLKDLPKIREICKKNEVKNYLTLNTIIYDKELKKLESIIKKSKPYVDAIICSDIAVILICKKYKIPFHVSTQCSISNSETARFYEKIGAERVILARELNLSQIKKISRILPIETFVHGAMCVSVSGRCFTSQFLFDKSANRGECLHPCRRLYNVKDEEGNELRIDNNFILSAKDLCALPFIEKLKKANIKAFKIEGRNREPEYVYAVTKIYRKAIDKRLTKKELEESIKELKKVYNKGFSSGFYLRTPTSDDFTETENSSATHHKEFIGKIYHYYSRINVGLIRMNAGKIKIGDEIFIIGKITGVLKTKVESMQRNHQQINEAKKGEEIGIKLPLCRKGDEVYKIVNNHKN
ncbi:MAG: U32 family peptidase [Candidatus Nanoarchaeia archaeon]|nr:U32 family peptidase [Candidatus Nanoarchaeia archaeon]